MKLLCGISDGRGKICRPTPETRNMGAVGRRPKRGRHRAGGRALRRADVSEARRGGDREGEGAYL